MTILKEMMHKHWSNLDGMIGLYEGANEADLTFKFQGIVWKAIENECDGYRSMLDQIAYDSFPEKFIAIDNLANVKVKRVYDSESIFFNGWELIDLEDEHVWLEVGTNHTDEWYPYIVFRHNPKAK